MASSSRALRSHSQTPSKLRPALAPGVDQVPLPNFTNHTGDTDEDDIVVANPRKRKKAFDGPAPSSSKPTDASAGEHHRFWYLCPIQNCSEGKSVARALKQHYCDKHPEENAKRAWGSELVERVDFIEWLNDRTRGKPTKQMMNRYPNLLHNGTNNDHLPNRAANASIIPLDENAASRVHEDALPIASSKPSKLGQLLDEHQANLEEFFERGLERMRKKVKRAKTRARKAEEEKEVLRRRMQAWEKKRDKEKLGEEWYREIEANRHYHRGRVEGKYQRTDVPATGGFIH